MKSAIKRKKVPNPNGRTPKYTPQVIKWIVANIGKKSRIAIQEHLNITRQAFRILMCRLRKEGYDIPMEKAHLVRVDSKVFAQKGVEPPKEEKRKGPTHKPADQHMRRKPEVENAKTRLPVFKDRAIVEGPIKVVFNDKGHTTISCRDEEHERKVRKAYAYLEKSLVDRGEIIVQATNTI